MDGFRIMSTDFISIKQIIETRKGGFIAVCIKESDLSAGTSQNGDWTKKVFTLQDETADIDITVWNDDIKIFKIGGKYELIGVYWKEYNQNWTANFGKYSSAKLIGTSVAVGTEQTTMPKTDPDMPAHGETPMGVDFKKLSEEAQATTLPAIGGSFAEFIEKQCIQLLQIEKVVKETMKKIEPTKIHEGQKVGMHVKEIYRESKKFKFEKASES